MEPFFSTKGEGGTGLGLSMVFGIVKRHSAALDIESQPGHGTTFRIWFPPCADDLPVTKEAAPELKGPLRVLVVDDEPVTRQVVSAFLQLDGHEVITATNGPEALSAFQHGPFDLLVTDCAMPEMSGFQLAGAVKELHQSQPVILLTGFSESALQTYSENGNVDLVIHKPVRHQSLRQAVAKAVAKADCAT